jgi:hypothetical protein
MAQLVWKVNAIHSFLVHPDKGADEQTTIGGTQVKGENRLVEMLTAVFMAAPDECKHDIYFLPNEAGEQKNDCRDLLLAHLGTPSKGNGLKLAQRLQSVTTHRSKLGLMFILVGSKGSSKRIVVSRFPADHGILADESETNLNVEFVERVFMQSATAYKSAVYEGTSDAHFWKGRAVDKQINSEVSVANYWIRDFLKSDFAVTGAAGTRRFAVNLRAAITDADTVAIKQELSSLAQLLPNMEGKIKNTAQILDDYHVSAAAALLIRNQFPSEKLYLESFKFTAEEFLQHIAFRSVELDNGALLTAPASGFDDVFTRQQTGNQVRFSTVGSIVDDKLRKTKS